MCKLLRLAGIQNGAPWWLGASRYFSIAALSISISISFVAECVSDQKGFDAERLYRRSESNFRADFDKSLEYIKLERERKAKAGEPQLSKEETETGLAGVQSLLYNKAISFVLCGEQAVSDGYTDRSNDKLDACFAARQRETAKFMKLSTEYASVLSDDKLLKCEMKSRDYESEIRFPPYEFLRNTRGPYVFDFKAMNECILSDK